MPNPSNVKKTSGIAFIASLSFLLAMPTKTAWAQSISIQETQSLTYPTLATTSSSVNFTINPLNSSTSGNAQVIAGVASRGQYTLSLTSGGNPVSISIDISNVSTGSAGLTLNNFTGYYKSTMIASFPSSTLSLPALSPSSTPLYIGATLTANSTVTVGTYNGSFSITVFVQ
jgi:hypothetical protein